MMVAIMQGMKQRISDQFNKLGANLIMVIYEPDHKAHTKATRKIDGFRMRDVQDIENYCNLVKAVSPELNLPGGGTAQYEGKHVDVQPYGVLPAYIQLRKVPLSSGQFINEEHVRDWSQVCVIGEKVQKELFDKQNPLGKQIEINGLPLIVIGVVAHRGRAFQGDLDTQVFIPLSTVQQRMLGSDLVGAIFAEPVSAKEMVPAEDQIWRLLMHRYADVPGVKVDSLGSIADSVNAIFAAFTLVLGSIAGLALLVGGIGIMNIMLVSVTERTREIGIRKAIGAKRKDVLIQFLIESATLSGMGGIAGVVIGTSMSYMVGYITSFVPQFKNQDGTRGLAIYVPPWVVIGAFLFSAGVGIFFGIYPAFRASRLDPIEALRHE